MKARENFPCNVYVSSFEAGLITRAMQVYADWHSMTARKQGIPPSEMVYALTKLKEIEERFKELI